MTSEITDDAWSQFVISKPSTTSIRTDHPQRNRERTWASWKTRAAASRASSSGDPTGGVPSITTPSGVPSTAVVGGVPSADVDAEEEVGYVNEKDLKMLHVKPQVPHFTFQPIPQITAKWAKLIPPENMHAWLDNRLCSIAPEDVKVCCEFNRDMKTARISLSFCNVHVWFHPSDPKLHPHAALVPAEARKRLGVQFPFLPGSITVEKRASRSTLRTLSPID